MFIVKCYLCCSTALSLQVSKGMNRDRIYIYRCQYVHKTIKGSNQLSDKCYFVRECMTDIWVNWNFQFTVESDA